VKRVTALHLAAPTGPAVPAVLFPADDQFLLPGRHEALFSFYRDVWPAPGEPLLPGIDAADVEHGRRALRERSAVLAESIVGGRAFYDAYAPQRIPRLDADPDRPGLVYVQGGSGSGVGLAPALAARALRACSLPTATDPPLDPAGRTEEKGDP
jgi:glycine/D-amino acid oxidase-like deaminating enzyme